MDTAEENIAERWRRFRNASLSGNYRRAQWFQSMNNSVTEKHSFPSSHVFGKGDLYFALYLMSSILSEDRSFAPQIFS